MKFHTEYLWFNTKKWREYIKITDKVAAAVRTLLIWIALIALGLCCQTVKINAIVIQTCGL